MYPLIFRARLFLHVILLASFMQTCAAQGKDDCSLSRSNSDAELNRSCTNEAKISAKPIEPTPCVDLERVDSGLVKVGIGKPGHYCLTEDLHSRFDMADHPAEAVMIVIQSNDVTLDLQGHTLGRGRLFKNPGGVGISINSAQNIHIKNGVLQDFKIAIIRGTKYPKSSDTADSPVYDAQTNTYRFPLTNIVVENVTFKNNKKDIVIEVKKDLTP
jgi:hypothetical protein